MRWACAAMVACIRRTRSESLRLGYPSAPVIQHQHSGCPSANPPMVLRSCPHTHIQIGRRAVSIPQNESPLTPLGRRLWREFRYGEPLCHDPQSFWAVSCVQPCIDLPSPSLPAIAKHTCTAIVGHSHIPSP